MRATEPQIKDAVKAVLNELGAWWCMPIPFSARGVGDFLACLNGQAVMIECKGEGKQQGPMGLQLYQAERFVAAGGRYFFIDSMERVEQLAKELA